MYGNGPVLPLLHPLSIHSTLSNSNIVGVCIQLFVIWSFIIYLSFSSYPSISSSINLSFSLHPSVFSYFSFIVLFILLSKNSYSVIFSDHTLVTSSFHSPTLKYSFKKHFKTQTHVQKRKHAHKNANTRTQTQTHEHKRKRAHTRTNKT